MNSSKLSTSEVPNFTFSEARWSQNLHISPISNSSHEIEEGIQNAADISFSKKIDNELRETTKNVDPRLENNMKDLKGAKGTSQVLNQPTVSQNIRAVSPIGIKKGSPPNSARLPYRESHRRNSISRTQKVDDQIQEESEQMNEIPLIETHVSDIRRKMRNYHPLQATEDPKTGGKDITFSELNQQVLQEFKKEHKAQRLAIQLKRLKQNRVDEMFDDIREETNKRIYSTVENLKTIRKQDAEFHQKLMMELEELNFLRKDLTQGFGNLQSKGNLDFKAKLARKLETKITLGCENCCNNIPKSPKNKASQFEAQNERIKKTDSASRIASKGYTNSSKSAEPSSRDFKDRISLLTGDESCGELIDRNHHIKRDLSHTTHPKKHRIIDKKHLNDIFNQNSAQININRKYIVPSDEVRPVSQREDFKDNTKRIQRGSPENLKNDFHVPYYLPRGSTASVDKQGRKTNKLDKIIETSQTMPERCFIKLTKLPFPHDHFVLNITAAYTTFKVELKLNETTEVDFAQKLQASLNSLVNFGVSESVYRRSSFISSLKPKNTIMPNLDSVNMSNSTLPPHKRSLSDIAVKCQACVNKIDGMKVALKAFTEIDNKAINLDAAYSEKLFEMLLKEKTASRDKQIHDENELKLNLMTACKGIETFLNSCFDIAPSHAIIIEKHFKSLIFFFEIRIRMYIQSQKSFLQEIEEGKFYLREKKAINEQLNQMKELNNKYLHDLRVTEKQAKDSKQKYEEQIKILMKKIEEFRGLQGQIKDAALSSNFKITTESSRSNVDS